MFLLLPLFFPRFRDPMVERRRRDCDGINCIKRWRTFFKGKNFGKREEEEKDRENEKSEKKIEKEEYRRRERKEIHIMVVFLPEWLPDQITSRIH